MNWYNQKAFILIVTLFIGKASFGQMGGGLRFVGNHYLANKDYQILSFGAFATYSLDPSQGFRLGYMQAIPYTHSYIHKGVAIDTATQPVFREIEQKVNLKSFSIFIDYQKYLSDIDEKNYGIYANVGFAFLSSKSLITYENDSPLYNLPNHTRVSEVEKFSQVYIRASLGFEVKIAVMKWYIEAGIGMPGSVNERRLVNDAYLPGYLEIATGIRF